MYYRVGTQIFSMIFLRGVLQHAYRRAKVGDLSYQCSKLLRGKDEHWKPKCQNFFGTKNHSLPSSLSPRSIWLAIQFCNIASSSGFEWRPSSQTCFVHCSSSPCRVHLGSLSINKRLINDLHFSEEKMSSNHPLILWRKSIE